MRRHARPCSRIRVGGRRWRVSPRDPGAKRFVGEITVPQIGEHQTALQRIATLNDDTREVFSPGYQESLDYVVNTLREAGLPAAGHAVQLSVLAGDAAAGAQPGHADAEGLRARRRRRTPTCRRPTSSRWRTRRRWSSPTRRCSRSAGSSTRPPAAPRSGCAAADYAGVSGKVALVQRGTCAFVEKWQFAQAAGATGVIIYNEGNTPARQNPIFVDNQPEPAATIAAVITSYALGNELLQAVQAGQEPDRGLQGLRHVHRPLPAAGDRRDARRRPEPRRDRRRTPGLGAGRPGHQRRRLRHVDAADDGPGARRGPVQPAQQGPLHVVRRGGERPRRLLATTPRTSARRKWTRST